MDGEVRDPVECRLKMVEYTMVCRVLRPGDTVLSCRDGVCDWTTVGEGRNDDRSRSEAEAMWEYSPDAMISAQWERETRKKDKILKVADPV